MSKVKHGMHKSKEYRAWADMKARCLNSKNRRYKDYGGRGITVCQKWLKFEGFFEDMGTAPEGKYSLDRIDNNKNYEVLNCRWATWKEQFINRRTTKLSEEHVPMIKVLAINGYSKAAIGRVFGVAGPYVGCIVAGKYRR